MILLAVVCLFGLRVVEGFISECSLIVRFMVRGLSCIPDWTGPVQKRHPANPKLGPKPQSHSSKPAFRWREREASGSYSWNDCCFVRIFYTKWVVVFTQQP